MFPKGFFAPRYFAPTYFSEFGYGLGGVGTGTGGNNGTGGIGGTGGMPTITVIESKDSRRETAGINPSMELEWIVKGTDDTDQINAILGSYTYAFWGVLPLRTIGPTVRLGPYIYKVKTRYDNQIANPQTGATQYTFSTLGGTANLKYGLLDNPPYYPGSGPTALPAPDGTIGAQADHTVTGVDIVVPNYKFEEVHFVPQSMITGSFKQILASLTGTVNKYAFREFNPGEVLFLGVDGQSRTWGDWQLTFHFSESDSIPAPGISMAGFTGVYKDGQDYFDFQFQPTHLPASGGGRADLRAQVKMLIVHQVYKRTDFSQLGIGTAPLGATN